MGREGHQGEVVGELLDARKAAGWSVLAALAHLGLAVVPAGSDVYDTLIAVGYPLLLPLIASVHPRHASVRRSGAILGTITGVAHGAIGIVGAIDPAARPAALVLLGMWWWTIGKMWAETAVLPRALGVVTAALGVAAFAAAALPIVFGARAGDEAAQAGHVAIALWLVAVAVPLWVRPDVPFA